MSEHETERKPRFSNSTMRTLNLLVLACAALLLVLELLDFDPPLSLLQIGLWVLVIGLCLYQLRKTPRQPKP